jgi:glutamate synthase domain-containing protein 3
VNISAKHMDYMELNKRIKNAPGDVLVRDCCGQRFIAGGLNEKKVIIEGTPGNALGAYLNGSIVEVRGNAQDAVGDTMNEGKIIVRGSAGDALGYAMRGGSIFVEGSAGYRTGIHMKEYKNKKPSIVVGRRTGSFLGEYLAGGLIVVLGLGEEGLPVGDFTGTGMHGGEIFIRTESEIENLAPQASAKIADKEDLKEIEEKVREFCILFGFNAEELLKDRYFVLRPDARNPYKQLYTMN